MGPFRLEPAGPVQAYKTYELRAPHTTHFRKASCAEVECEAWRNGWVTSIDVNTALGGQQANYIRLHSGRVFTVAELNNLVAFTFSPGQECFREHHVPLEREPFYVVRGGDWRATVGGGRNLSAVNWVDDFATHQERIKTEIEKG